MKQVVLYKKKFEEEDEEAKSLKVIEDLIDMEEIDTEEEQGKFLALIKGLIFADNKHGDAFLKKINDFTSTLKIEDFKEGCKKGKGTKKKDFSENFSYYSDQLKRLLPITEYGINVKLTNAGRDGSTHTLKVDSDFVKAFLIFVKKYGLNKN